MRRGQWFAIVDEPVSSTTRANVETQCAVLAPITEATLAKALRTGRHGIHPRWYVDGNSIRQHRIIRSPRRPDLRRFCGKLNTARVDDKLHVRRSDDLGSRDAIAFLHLSQGHTELRQIYIDGELDLVDPAQYFPKIQRKEYTVALNLQTAGPDPDPIVQLFYGCGSNLNWDNYCNPEMDKMIEAQSREGDAAKRRHILWTIERKLADDNVRPIIFYRRGGTCERPYVKGLTIMVNSIFDNCRMEDVWLNK
jgi:hypothetical protein